MYSLDWSAVSNGSLPPNWTGDSTYLNVQATPIAGSAKSLQSSVDGGATHKVYYTANDGVGGDGTFVVNFYGNSIGLFLFRLSSASGSAYNAYSLQFWGDPNQGGVYLDRSIAGSSSAGGGGNVAKIVNPGASGTIDFGVLYTATIVAKGNAFTVQIQRGTDSKYLTSAGSWQTVAVNAMTVSDVSGSAISGTGQFGFLEYSGNSQQFNFGPLSITPLAVSAALGATTVSTGSVATACTATGFTNLAVNWTSSNSAVATINPSTGVPTGIGPGTCTFQAVGVANNTQTATTGLFTVTANVGTLTAGSASVVSHGATTASLTASNSSGGTGPYSYQWYRSTANGTLGSAVSGATTLVLVDSGLTVSTAYYYTLKYTDSSGSPATVSSAQVSVTTSGPLIAGSATVGTVTGSTITISATDATGGMNPYAYQWYRSTANGTLGSAVSGATTLVLVDSGLTVSTAYYYTLKYTDSSGSPATVSSAQVTGTTLTQSVSVTVTSLAPFGQGYPDLVGTIGVKVSILAGGTLTTLNARTTNGIVQSGTGMGDYLTQAQATPGTTVVFAWDTGGSSPLTLTDIVTAPSGILASNGLDLIMVETGINARQALSPILAASAGVIVGNASGNPVVKAPVPGNPTRISATSANGDRTSTTLTLPP